MDDVVTQLGLLLTQTRFARRALEDIERATTRYGSVVLSSSATTSGAPFGAPPLLDGALRVYVVNIGDLSPATGLFDVVAGVLGGIGSFVGNLIGGAVGGAAATPLLIAYLPTLNTIVGRVETIIDKLGFAKAAPEPAAAAAESAKATASTTPAPPAAGGQMDFMAQLSTLQGKFEMVAKLFEAANGPAPNGAAGGVAQTALDAPDAKRYREWVDSLTAALETGSRLARGLTVVIPMAVAALSWLLDRLPDLRNAITETLQFIVRSVLVLRGVVIVLAFETIAMIARVAAATVRILAATVNDALAALFAALGKLLNAVLDLGEVLGKAVADTVNQLLDWLSVRVYNLLWTLGELRLFRVVEKLVDSMATIASAFKKDATNTPPAGPPKPPAPPAPPNLAEIMQTARAGVKTATDRITSASKELVNKPTSALAGGLGDVAKALDDAAAKEVKNSDTALAGRLKSLGESATESAKNLLPLPTDKPKGNVWDRVRGETAFHPVAEAYGQWLATGGLKQLLYSMTTYFDTPRSRPGDTPPTSTETVPVVQIDEVVIELVPVGAPTAAPRGSTPRAGAVRSSKSDSYLLERHAAERSLAMRRGIRGQDPQYVPIFDFDDLD